LNGILVYITLSPLVFFTVCHGELIGIAYLVLMLYLFFPIAIFCYVLELPEVSTERGDTQPTLMSMDWFKGKSTGNHRFSQ
jgi:hypothetical protein